MSRKSLPVVLTPAELTRLKQWIQAGSTPQQVVLRARIIEAATGAKQDREIAPQLQVHRRTVALGRSRARQQGIGCVWELATGRGRKTRYGAGKAAAIVEATLQTKPPGSTHWSTPRKLAQAQGVSKNTIARVWQEHQLKPLRHPRPRTGSPLAGQASSVRSALHPHQFQLAQPDRTLVC